MSTMFHNKQLLDEVFVMSRIIKVRGKCMQLSAKPKAEAGNTNRELVYLGYQKTNLTILLFYYTLF